MPTDSNSSAPHGDGRSRTRASIAVPLVLLLLLALALRLWVSWPNPGPKRFWDEKYLTANTARALTDGWTHPQNVYYPGLGHFPAASVLLALDKLGVKEADELATSRRQLAPLGYRVARSLNALWGAAGIGFVFLLGSALGGHRLGLLAAVVFAVVPWHLRQSIIYKPDIALCTLVTASLWTTVRLASVRGGRGRWVAAWLTAALAVSAKWNAAPLLIPLLWAAASRVRLKGRSEWKGCLLGVLLGSACLVALNPSLILDPDAYRRDLLKTASHYRGQSELAEASHLEMPVHALQSLASTDFLGLGLALFAAVGTGMILRAAYRDIKDPEQRTRWILPGLWGASYIAIYSVATAYPSPHNWLPLLPVAALAAALAGLSAFDLARATSGRRGALLIVLVGAALLAERAVRISEFAIREAVPTTAHAAERELDRAFVSMDGRVVASEVPLHDRLQGFAVQSRTLDPKRPRLSVLQPTDLRLNGSPSQGPPHRSDQPNAPHPSSWLDWTDAALWQVSLAQPCEAPGTRIQKKLFRRRGETLCLLVDAKERTPILEGLELDVTQSVIEIPWPETSGRVAAADPPSTYSLDLLTGVQPNTDLETTRITLAIDGQGETRELACPPVSGNARRLRCRTPRFERGDTLRVQLPKRARRVALWLDRWTPAPAKPAS